MIPHLFFAIGFFSVYGQSLTNTVHKTQAAAEKINDLHCHTCETMEDGELCVELVSNQSTFKQKCKSNEFTCMVKRFSYTTSTENATSKPKLWSLERKCTVKCEPGCIVIGERTKLYACTSCCAESNCNIGKGKSHKIRPSALLSSALYFSSTLIMSYIFSAQNLLIKID